MDTSLFTQPTAAKSRWRFYTIEEFTRYHRKTNDYQNLYFYDTIYTEPSLKQLFVNIFLYIFLK